MGDSMLNGFQQKGLNKNLDKCSARSNPRPNIIQPFYKWLMVAKPGKFQIMFLGLNITLMVKLRLW